MTDHTYSEEYYAWLRSGPPPRRGGSLVVTHAARIKRLIDITGADSLLDFYSGNQHGYEADVMIPESGARSTLQDYWDLAVISCFDPRIPVLARRPEKSAAGAICANALSSVPLTDVPLLLDELFSLASSFVFIAVDCTQRPDAAMDARFAVPGQPQWWRDAVTETAAHHPRVAWELVTRSHLPKAPKAAVLESIFSSLTTTSML